MVEVESEHFGRLLWRYTLMLVRIARHGGLTRTTTPPFSFSSARPSDQKPLFVYTGTFVCHMAAAELVAQD